MAKITSKDLEAKADELTKKIEESRERYADLILEGRPDKAQMAEMATLETEFKSTVAAIEIARRREKEEAERQKWELQEKAKSEAGKIRAAALKQLEAVIDNIIETVNGANEFMETVQKGKDALFSVGLPGGVMRDSEYYQVMENVFHLAVSLFDAFPKQAYPGHDDLKAELAPVVNKLRKKVF